MRVSCAIRAHPDRRHLVEELAWDLGTTNVVWDRKGSSWDTGVRAWQAHDPAADWHLVVEDDAVVCRDLLPGLAMALNSVPLEAGVSLYLGDSCGSPQIVQAIADREATPDPSPWLQARRLIWGVAIALPVASIPGMLVWCGRLRNHYGPHVYDTRIAKYYAEHVRWPAYYTWPSLVDHRQVTSLIGHAEGRRAHTFIGEDASAFDIDWSISSTVRADRSVLHG